jgi:hypothetical protein
MTAVLHSQRNARDFSSDSEEYNSPLPYLTDSGSEGYSGNHASPLVDEDVGGLKISPKISASTSLPKYRNTKVQDAGAQLSMVALVLATVRKSLLTCQTAEEVEIIEGERERSTDKVKEKEKGKGKDIKMSMDIGWPTDVEHVAHVTFDRYNGFLGLPEEYEHEVPRPTPSARLVCFLIRSICMCYSDFFSLWKSLFWSFQCIHCRRESSTRYWSSWSVPWFSLAFLIFEDGSVAENVRMSFYADPSMLQVAGK